MNEWGEIIQITRIISSPHIWLHFNFIVLKEEHLSPHIFRQVKGQVPYVIITFIPDDRESNDYAKSMHAKLMNPKLYPSKLVGDKRLLTLPITTIIPEELELLSFWTGTHEYDAIGPGLLVSICNEKKARIQMKQLKIGMQSNIKMICEADYDEFLEEKDSIYIWLFENYKKRNVKLKVDDALTEEFKQALATPVEESRCNLI